MLERGFLLRPYLRTVLSMGKWQEKIGVTFTSGDWDVMEKAVSVLRPFKEATDMLSCEDSSISQVSQNYWND